MRKTSDFGVTNALRFALQTDKRYYSMGKQFGINIFMGKHFGNKGAIAHY